MRDTSVVQRKTEAKATDVNVRQQALDKRQTTFDKNSNSLFLCGCITHKHMTSQNYHLVYHLGTVTLVYKREHRHEEE